MSFIFSLFVALQAASAEIDRRPGILEPPSPVPTGENAYLYEEFLKEIESKMTDREIIEDDPSYK